MTAWVCVDPCSRLCDRRIEVRKCASNGNFTPCVGGADAGVEGVGYCAEGYRGPRCEICSGLGYSRYFDKLEARCHDCGDMTLRTTVVASV
eukprot:3805086-Prymnesium_polylepis.1